MLYIISLVLNYNWKFVPFDLFILHFTLNWNGESQKNFKCWHERMKFIYQGKNNPGRNLEDD